MKKKSRKISKASSWEEENRQLSALGLIVKDVAGDGNCLFRALADQLDGLPSKHDTYRQRICNFIEINPDIFQPFLETPIGDYVSSMRKCGAWGGYPEIQAVSLIFKVNIMIHIVDSSPLEFKNFPSSSKTLHLCYHNGEHYSSVRRIDESKDHTGPPLPIQILCSETNEYIWETKMISLSTGILNNAFIKIVLYQMGDVDTAINFIHSFQDDIDEDFIEKYIDENSNALYTCKEPTSWESKRTKSRNPKK